MVGKVQRYNAKKGNGFIQSGDNSFFFMWTDIEKKHKSCKKGETVSFNLFRDEIGLRAINVKECKA